MAISHEMAQNSLPMTLVVSPKFFENHATSVNRAVKLCGTGICIRFPIADMMEDLTSDCNHIRNLTGLTESNIDLILDVQTNTRLLPSLATIMNGIPKVNSWRTITVTSGAMTIDLSGFPGGISEHPRLDWLGWYQHLYSNQTLLRIPSFSDYTIRHAAYSEVEGPVRTSASIRYASAKYWLILRGEWLLKPGGLGFGQYYGLSQLLVERPEYCGADYSAGDELISQKSREEGGTGSITTWIQIGINHHLTLVVDQISKLAENTAVV